MIDDEWSEAHLTPLVVERSSKNRTRELRWVTDDVLEVGATASTMLSVPDSTLATSLMLEDTPTGVGHPMTAAVEAAASIACAATGFVVRRRLAAARRSRAVTEAALVQYRAFLNGLDQSQRAAASAVLRLFVVRWRAWSRGRASKRHHTEWCEAQGRAQPMSLFPDANGNDDWRASDGSIATALQWQRPRGLVSWSLYSAPPSPFLPTPPMQRWLAHTHKGTARQTRILQRFWKHARCRQFSSRLWKAAYAAKFALATNVDADRCNVAVQEARGWYDIRRHVAAIEEATERASIVERCEVHLRHVEEREALYAQESASRRETLLPLWSDVVSAVVRAQETSLLWREDQSRHLLTVRSIIKLDATYKEAWFQRSHANQTLWFELSSLAVDALLAGSMTLGPSDLLVSVRNTCTWGSTHKRVPSAVLRGIVSTSDLCALVDAWALRLRHDEAVAWGMLNEQFGRRMLRRRLLCELPLENAMLDQERRHRAVLVTQMLKGSLSYRASSPPVVRRPLVDLRGQQELGTSGEEVFSSLMALSSVSPTVVERALSPKEESKVPSSTASPPSGSPTTPQTRQLPQTQPSLRDLPHRRVPTAPTALRGVPDGPRPPRRVGIGRDGYRTGVSPALEKAMIGRKSSAWASSATRLATTKKASSGSTTAVGGSQSV